MKKEVYNPELDQYKRLRELGKQPKPESQRELMRQAKQGVPKSDEHRDNMRETQLKLGKIFTAIMNETGMTYQQSKKEYTRRREAQVEKLIKETGQSRRWALNYIKEKGL